MKLFRELLLNLKSLRKSRKVQRNKFLMLQHVPSLGSVKLTSPTCNWTIIPQRLVTKSRFISFLSFPGKWFQSTDHIFRAAAKKKSKFHSSLWLRWNLTPPAKESHPNPLLFARRSCSLSAKAHISYSNFIGFFAATATASSAKLSQSRVIMVLNGSSVQSTRRCRGRGGHLEPELTASEVIMK